MAYLFYFLIAFALAVGLTPLVRKLALGLKIVDLPDSSRKIHGRPVPLLGGVALFCAWLLALGLYIIFGHPNFQIVPIRFFVGMVLGGLVLIIGGVLDDKYNLPPKILWLFPAAAALIVPLSGIGVGIKFLSDPFGNPISLDYAVLGLPLSGIFIWLWMMGMIFTTKILDGLDGLCGGIAFIGGLTMFLISLGPKVNQPITATLALIFCGALLGYLIYAFFPASVFLGEGGSTFLGFMLGVLSVILGAKIATALLVMGIPIMDFAWVIVRRLWYHRSPFSGDRRHLHFRLLDIGLSQRQAVFVLYGISAVFGGVAVFLQSLGKLIALVILFCVMIGLAIAIVMIYKKQHPHIPDLFDYAENKPPLTTNENSDKLR